MEYCHLGTLWSMIGEVRAGCLVATVFGNKLNTLSLVCQARRLSNVAARGQQPVRTNSNRWGFAFWKSWERRMEVS